MAVLPAARGRTVGRLRPTGRCAWRCSLRLAVGRSVGPGPLDAAHGGAPFGSRTDGRPAGAVQPDAARGGAPVGSRSVGRSAQAHLTLRMVVLPSARSRSNHYP